MPFGDWIRYRDGEQDWRKRERIEKRKKIKTCIIYIVILLILLLITFSTPHDTITINSQI